VALRAVGWEAEVFELTPGRLASRGAGIVVQPELLRLLAFGGAPGLPTTSCNARLYLDPAGRAETVPMVQRFTSWQAIHDTLKAAFPQQHYHSGRPVEGWASAPQGVRVSLANGASEEADLLVIAEGWRSKSREKLLPETRPEYAGYVAWRGTVDEAELRPDLIAFFDDRFVFCDARSGAHALSYFIPGADGLTKPGARRLNWVWYVPSPEGERLDRLLTTKDGERRTGSVPPGSVPTAVADEVRAAARAELHGRFAGLIDTTAEPFLQAIFDLGAPRMRFERACLLGDAAFVVRPHTAGATAKAAADALTLASVLRSEDDVDRALSAYEARRLPAGQAMLGYGVALGRRFASALQ